MIYVDNSATTKIDRRVLKAMEPYLLEEYGNPSSDYYDLGIKAKDAVEKARFYVAELINAEPKEIIFTSSGSESNNFIIKGIADYEKYYNRKRPHLITSSVEHKSVLNTYRFLDGEIYLNKEINKFHNSKSNKIDRGYEIDFLEVDKFGLIKFNDLKEKIKKDTSLISLIYVNNETGNTNNIEEIGKYLENKNIFFHTDATQAIGKVDIDVKKLKVDGLTFSSHKIHGPKGVAAAYIKSDKYKLKDMTALIHGGENVENGYRAGTSPVYSIVGFGEACRILKEELDERIKLLLYLENEFIKMIKSVFNDIIFVKNLSSKHLVPGIVSFILPKFNNQITLRKISDQMAMSSGSACTISGDSTLMETLGYDKYKSNFYRVSFSKDNNIDDIKKMKEVFLKLKETN